MSLPTTALHTVFPILKSENTFFQVLKPKILESSFTLLSPRPHSYTHPNYQQSLLTLLLKCTQNLTLLTTVLHLIHCFPSQCHFFFNSGYGISLLTSFSLPSVVYCQLISHRDIYQIMSFICLKSPGVSPSCST